MRPFFAQATLSRCARLTFFAAAKKVSKESGFPPTQLTRHARVKGIFRLAIHGSLGKRRPSMGDALRVCEAQRRSSSSESKAGAAGAFPALHLPSAAKDARTLILSADPEGAAQDVRRFSMGQDVPSKNPEEAHQAS
jgi:hypothetical protein